MESDLIRALLSRSQYDVGACLECCQPLYLVYTTPLNSRIKTSTAQTNWRNIICILSTSRSTYADVGDIYVSSREFCILLMTQEQLAHAFMHTHLCCLPRLIVINVQAILATKCKRHLSVVLSVSVCALFRSMPSPARLCSRAVPVRPAVTRPPRTSPPQARVPAVGFSRSGPGSRKHRRRPSSSAHRPRRPKG